MVILPLQRTVSLVHMLGQIMIFYHIIVLIVLNVHYNGQHIKDQV